jgi:hypothetical protein
MCLGQRWCQSLSRPAPFASVRLGTAPDRAQLPPHATDAGVRSVPGFVRTRTNSGSLAGTRTSERPIRTHAKGRLIQERAADWRRTPSAPGSEGGSQGLGARPRRRAETPERARAAWRGLQLHLRLAKSDVRVEQITGGLTPRSTVESRTGPLHGRSLSVAFGTVVPARRSSWPRCSPTTDGLPPPAEAGRPGIEK